MSDNDGLVTHLEQRLSEPFSVKDGGTYLMVLHRNAYFCEVIVDPLAMQIDVEIHFDTGSNDPPSDDAQGVAADMMDNWVRGEWEERGFDFEEDDELQEAWAGGDPDQKVWSWKAVGVKRVADIDALVAAIQSIDDTSAQYNIDEAYP